jgi:Bacterial Ig domain/Bacterial Ig-like domain (group 1)/Bacterial Ig-like domain (group 3)
VNAKTLAIALLAGLPLINAACGGDNLTLPSEGAPAHIEILGGNNQEGRVGTALGDSLLALVTDAQNRPVAGATVEFVLVDNRGGGQVTPASGQTNAAGEVRAAITLGSQVGPMTGQAQIPVAQGATPIAAGFTAVVLAADANGIAMVSGDAQSGPVGSTLPSPLVVQVTDAFGNPISGITVTWSAEGQGAVSAASTVTDASGQTSVTRTLGPNSGLQTTLATAGGLAGSPVTFTSTAAAGNASRIEIVSGNNQNALAGSVLPEDFVVRVLDQDGNPIVGRAVSWVIGQGGGSINPETNQTDGEGKASARLTLGSTPGTNTVNAVVSGIEIPTVTFTATGTGTGSPTNLALTTQPPASVQVGATLTPGPVVQVRDGAGHDLAVAGVEVTVAVASGHGQLSGTQTVATDGNGRAQFGDLRITGATGSHRLIFAAEGFRSVTSDRFEVVKASTTTAITAQDPATSDPNQPVTISFTVTSSTPGTPSGTVELKASDSEKCTAPAPTGSCQITFVGTGDRIITATYSGDAVFATSSGTATHHVNEPVPPPNNPPVAVADAFSTPAAQLLSVAAPGVLANDSDPDGNPITVQSATQPAIGLVTINPDGSFTYFPGTAASGSQDSFTYTVSDGTLTATATVTITIQ